MIEHSEERRAERLTLPARLSDRGLADRPVRLVNLSLGGACVEHLRPLPAWGTCFLGLAQALGCIHLEGQVVWSQPAGKQPDGEGRPQAYYRGVRFAWLTSEQQAGLAAALEILKSAAARPPDLDSQIALPFFSEAAAEAKRPERGT